MTSLLIDNLIVWKSFPIKRHIMKLITKIRHLEGWIPILDQSLEVPFEAPTPFNEKKSWRRSSYHFTWIGGSIGWGDWKNWKTISWRKWSTISWSTCSITQSIIMGHKDTWKCPSGWSWKDGNEKFEKTWRWRRSR